VFPKDKYEGEFFEDWNKAVNDAKFEKSDMNSMFANIFAIKDDAEIANIKKACDITSKVFGKYLKDQIVTIIDGEKVKDPENSYRPLPLAFKFKKKIAESKTRKTIRRC
jgi:nucleosome binding factor SPN SPT16 subunit